MINPLRHRWPKFLALALCLTLSAGCTKAHKARRLVAAAQRDFQATNYDSAEIEFRSAARISSPNPDAIRGLGLLYFEEGRPQYAYSCLKETLKQDPANAQLQLKLAETCHDLGQAREALDLVTSVLKSEPANDHALVLLAQLSSTNDLLAIRRRLEAQLHQAGHGAAACHCALGWIALRTQQLNDAQADFQQASTLDPKLVSPCLGMAVLGSLRNDTNTIAKALKTAADLSPLRSFARVQYADFLFQSGAPDDAARMLDDITRRAPDYLPAWLALMKLSLAQQKLDLCKNAIDNILSRDGVNFDATLNSGVLALARRDAPKAIGIFQNMDAMLKGNPQVKYHLAAAHLANNERQLAVASLQDALNLDRNFSPAVLLLAEVDFRSGNLTEAVNLLSRLVQNHPEDFRASQALAETFLAQQRPDRAIEVYQRMERFFPKNPEPPCLIGLVCVLQRNIPAARAAFAKSLALAPGFPPALKQITELDISDKSYADAHTRLAAVIRQNPGAADPLLLQGKVYWAEGKSNQAEASFSRAIELNPELPAPYLSLAQLYMASHQDQQALDSLATLVAKTNSLGAMLEISQIHQAAGRYEQARDACRKILDINPKFVPALNNLAYLDAEYLGRLDDALKLAETARQLRPYDPYTADTLGWILFKKHEYPHALGLIRESADRQPDNPEVQLHLGLAYCMLEEEQPARLCLERALASRSDFPGKDLARRRLELLDINPSTATPAQVSQLEALLRDNPHDPVPLSRMAAIHEERGDAQKAADLLQSLIAANPQDAQAMIRLSRLCAGPLNNLRKALDLAKSAHNLAPDDPRASALLGELVFQSGDFPWALSLLEQAANQSSDQPSLSYHLARACYAMGRLADADTAMQKALLQHDSPARLADARQFLALRAAAADPAQALASAPLAKQILDTDPNCVPAIMVSAMAARGRGDADQAALLCQKALSIYPAFAPAMLQLAVLYSQSTRSADLDKAYDWAEKARLAMPDDLELARTLGLLACKRADYNRSLPLLRQYTEKSTNDAEAFFYLGMDYYQLRQSAPGKAALQRALDLHLADDLADRSRRMLNDLK
jgi:tetratricopeptide (TPR) repeat protein